MTSFAVTDLYSKFIIIQICFLCIHFSIGSRDPSRRRSCDQTREGSRLTADELYNDSQIPQIAQVYDLIVVVIRVENGVNTDNDFQTSLASQGTKRCSQISYCCGRCIRI